MKHVTTGLMIRAMASAGTVVTLVTIVGAGRKWTNWPHPPRSPRSARPRALTVDPPPDLFVGLALLAGLGCLLGTLVVQLSASWAGVGVQCYVLAVFLVVGELRAIPVPRGDDTTDALTVSSTFATALVLIGPLGLALVAQALAVAMDDAVQSVRGGSSCSTSGSTS